MKFATTDWVWEKTGADGPMHSRTRTAPSAPVAPMSRKKVTNASSVTVKFRVKLLYASYPP